MCPLGFLLLPGREDVEDNDDEDQEDQDVDDNDDQERSTVVSPWLPTSLMMNMVIGSSEL